MAALDDLIARMIAAQSAQPDPAERRRQALMATGAGLLAGSNRGFFPALGQGAVMGINQAQEYDQSVRRDQLAQFENAIKVAQMQRWQAEQAEREQERQRAQEQQALRGRAGALYGAPNLAPLATTDPNNPPRLGMEDAVRPLLAAGDYEGAAKLRQALPSAAAEKPLVVAPGSTVLDPRTMRPTFTAPVAEKPEATPEVIRVLDALQKMAPDDPRRASLEQWVRTKTSHAPAPSANVYNVGEKAEAKKVGEAMGETFVDLQKADVAAGMKLAKLDRMEQLLEGVETGKLTPTMTEIESIAASLGLPVSKTLGPKQAAMALANEMALQMRNPAGGAGMPGALSDRDREFLLQMTPNLSQTPEGRKLLIATYRKLSQRERQVAKMARDYRQRNGSLDTGFYTELAKFSDTNPLFQSAPKVGATNVDDLVNKWLR